MFDIVIETKNEYIETISRRHEEAKREIINSIKTIYGNNEPKTTDNSERLKKTSADLMYLLED